MRSSLYRPACHNNNLAKSIYDEFFFVKFTPLTIMMEIKEEVIGWVALQLNQLIVISAITCNVIDVSQEFSND